jgi:phospholipid/cholesterol/gamma-HCH transport system substrate-binding protein
MSNIRSSTKGLDENMNAAKENFLLKGYFNRKAKEAEDAKEDSAKLKAKEQKAIVKATRKKNRK